MEFSVLEINIAYGVYGVYGEITKLQALAHLGEIGCLIISYIYIYIYYMQQVHLCLKMSCQDLRKIVMLQL